MAETLWLFRHGETEWSLSGQHTSRTDLPLTDNGCKQACATAHLFAGKHFNLVLTSPMSRARATSRLAGFSDAQVDPDLMEWDYGDYEGRKTADIRKDVPGWSLWSDGVPNGETAQQVAARAQAVIARAVSAGGDVALFGHGHILRVLTASWLGLPPQDGRLFALETGTISKLGHEHETRVITAWNLR